MGPRSNYSMFLGDLSIFCTEQDIHDAFNVYGEILSIRVLKHKETERALSYGFIQFSCETAAVTAMNEMQGFVLKGRPLRWYPYMCYLSLFWEFKEFFCCFFRIRWAVSPKQPIKSDPRPHQCVATIFVKFASQTGVIVNEEMLRNHFSVFGAVVDTTIRTITIDEVTTYSPTVWSPCFFIQVSYCYAISHFFACCLSDCTYRSTIDPKAMDLWTLITVGGTTKGSRLHTELATSCTTPH